MEYNNNAILNLLKPAKGSAEYLQALQADLRHVNRMIEGINAKLNSSEDLKHRDKMQGILDRKIQAKAELIKEINNY